MFFVSRCLMTYVKGTKIHEPQAIQLTEQGLVGDRAFYLIDGKDRVVNGRQIGALATIESHYDADTHLLSLIFPDGRVYEEAVEHTGETVVTDFMSHDVKGHIVAGGFAELLTETTGRELRLVEADEVGAGSDRHPVTIVSSASIEFLRTRSPEARHVDYRRFRTLIEIGGCRPHEEDTWFGKLVHLGDAILEVLEPVPRCSVIRQDPETGERSFDALKALFAYRKSGQSPDFGPPIQQPASERQILFGMYARVHRPGTVSVGDQVRTSEA